MAETPQLLTGAEYNATPPTLSDKQKVALQVDSSGKLLTTGTFTGTVTANADGKATAADPVYVEGSLNPLSQNLSGYQRSVLGPGNAAIGNVGGKTASISVTPTVTASNAYGVNYVVGGLLSFANAFTATGSGILQGVVVTCKKVETVGFTFIPFHSNPSATTWTDAAVAAINAADVSLVRNPVALSNNSQLGTCTVISAAGLGQAISSGTTTLYGVLLVSGALTNNFGSTSDITVTVKILQDI